MRAGVHAMSTAAGTGVAMTHGSEVEARPGSGLFELVVQFGGARQMEEEPVAAAAHSGGIGLVLALQVQQHKGHIATDVDDTVSPSGNIVF